MDGWIDWLTDLFGFLISFELISFELIRLD